MESGCTVAGAFLTVTKSGPVVPGSEVEGSRSPCSSPAEESLTGNLRDLRTSGRRS